MGCGNGRCCSGRVAAGRSGCLLMVSGGPPGLTRLRCGVAFTTAMFAGAPNTWSPLVPPRRNAGDEKPRCSAPDVTAPKAKLRWAGHFSGVSVRLTALPRMGEVVLGLPMHHFVVLAATLTNHFGVLETALTYHFGALETKLTPD